MYEKMYYILFHAITNAMEKIEWQDYQTALFLLEKACQDAEEIYTLQGPEIKELDETPPPPDFCPRWCLQEIEIP